MLKAITDKEPQSARKISERDRFHVIAKEVMVRAISCPTTNSQQISNRSPGTLSVIVIFRAFRVRRLSWWRSRYVQRMLSLRWMCSFEANISNRRIGCFSSVPVWKCGCDAIFSRNAPFFGLCKFWICVLLECDESIAGVVERVLRRPRWRKFVLSRCQLRADARLTKSRKIGVKSLGFLCWTYHQPMPCRWPHGAALVACPLVAPGLAH